MRCARIKVIRLTERAIERLSKNQSAIEPIILQQFVDSEGRWSLSQILRLIYYAGYLIY